MSFVMKSVHPMVGYFFLPNHRYRVSVPFFFIILLQNFISLVGSTFTDIFSSDDQHEPITNTISVLILFSETKNEFPIY